MDNTNLIIPSLWLAAVITLGFLLIDCFNFSEFGCSPLRASVWGFAIRWQYTAKFEVPCVGWQI